MTFSVPIVVRSYELDLNGHLNQAVYLQYAEHARWSLLKAAGITPEKLIACDVGPVTLENVIRYYRELRDGDEVTVSCAFGWDAGKTFTVTQEIRKPDDSVAATIAAVGGLLNLTTRKLLPTPESHLRPLADTPELLGI